jgi:hypothetical protein
MDAASRARKIHERELREMSIATFPLLAGARVDATWDKVRGAAPAVQPRRLLPNSRA